MKSFLERLLGRTDASTRGIAKDRLRLVLLQDRASIPPEQMENMRLEILQVLQKYVEIEEDELDMKIERGDGAVALVANIPIRRVLS